MAGNISNLVDSIGGLSLAEQAPELTGSKFEHGDAAAALIEAIQGLIQSADATTTQAHHVRNLANIENLPRGSNVTKLNTLRTRTKELARVQPTTAVPLRDWLNGLDGAVLATFAFWQQQHDIVQFVELIVGWSSLHR